MVDIFNSPVKQLIVPSEVPTEENRKLISYGVEAQPLDGFVAVDIGALSAHHTDQSLSAQNNNNNNKNLARTLSRNWKGSQKTSDERDINCSTGGGVAVAVEKLKQDTCANVAVGNIGHSHGHTGMATAAAQAQGGKVKVRRFNSSSHRNKSSHSQTQWINPRRVLFTFATVSSMGTLILLYFTLSMGKMAMEDPNIR